MSNYSLTHLSTSKLRQDLRSGTVDDRAALAMRLAQIAEFDRRRLHLPSYPSMYRFCVLELKYSEDAACKRICAARAARRFPAIFAAIADGRLNLSTVVMLVPYLLPETADDLISAAANLSKVDLAVHLAERFPRPDVPTLVVPVPAPGSAAPPAVLVQTSLQAPPTVQACPLGTATPLELSAPGRISPMDSASMAQSVVPLVTRARVAPLSPERFAIQVTVSKATQDKLRHAQDLLSHALPSGDVAEVLDRALDALILQLERRKFAATERPARYARPSSGSPRHIPAAVRRAVWKRDGGCCTFADDHGHRCEERKFLEYDHVDPVARGGQATVSGVRLRCRAHNQFTAERVFGAGFMENKRNAARTLPPSMKTDRAARA